MLSLSIITGLLDRESPESSLPRKLAVVRSATIKMAGFPFLSSSFAFLFLLLCCILGVLHKD